MKQASLILGIITIVGMLIGFIPCLGWLNWLNIPLAIVGIVLGAIAQSNDREMIRAQQEFNPELRIDNRAPLGLILCSIAFVLGAFRLIIGFGIF